MNLYMASTLAWGYEANEAIKIAKQHHFQGVEIWAEHIAYHDTDPKSIVAAAQEEQIDLTLHAASWDLNICSLNDGILTQSIIEILKSIDLANGINARNVTLHPGRLTINGHNREKHLQVMKESLKRLVTYANKYNVKLSLELMEPIKKELITTPIEMNAFLSELPEELKVTFDIAHVPLTERPDDYLEQLNRVNKIHLSDSTVNKYHVPLGAGDLKLESVLAQLEKLPHPVVLEGFDTSRELSFLKRHLQYLRNTDCN